MKMKHYAKPASFMALMIIGLLVITGCQGVFEPPAKQADGTGTLLVSINGADGRTITPAVSALDKYDLQLFTGASLDEPLYATPLELTGSIALGLTAGDYKIVVNGYLGDEIVAEAEENATIVTEQVAAVNIVLEPKATGNGTFSWDFTDIDPDDVAIEIYDIEDEATDLYDDTADLTGVVELPRGIYNVKFDLDGIVWWEILYIYPGLDSFYDASDIVGRDIIGNEYQTPASGPGFFYLNLNNWERAGTSEGGLNPTVPTGTIDSGSLNVTFDANGQRLHIKLTADQIDLMMASHSILVTINGTADEDNNFRFHLTNPEAGGSWNATNQAHEGAANTAFLNNPKWTDFSGNKSLATVSYLTIQHRSAGPTELEIDSIMIEYGIDESNNPVSGVMYLDLSAYDYEATEQTRVYATNLDYDNGTFEATFANSQFVNIAIPSNIGNPPTLPRAVLANAEYVYVTVWGSGPTGNYRYYLGDLNQGGWNATDPAKGAGGGGTDIANLMSVSGVTSAMKVNTPANVKYFILNSQGGTGKVEITQIRIAYKLKVWVRPDPAAADLAIIGGDATIATQTITKESAPGWQNSGGSADGIEVAWDGSSSGNATALATPAVTVALPGGILLGAYDKYTLIMKAYDGSDNEIPNALQFCFVSSASNFWNNRIDTFRAGGNDVAKALIQAELEASTIGGIYIQPRGDVTGIMKIVIEEFTLLKP